MTDKFEVLTPGVLKSEGDVFKTIPNVSALPTYTSDYQGTFFYVVNGGVAKPYFGDESGFRPVLLDKNGSLLLNGKTLTFNDSLTVNTNSLVTAGGATIDATSKFLSSTGGSIAMATTTAGTMDSTVLPGRPAGTLVYHTTLQTLYTWDGSAWRQIGVNPADYVAAASWGYAINTAISGGSDRNILNFQDGAANGSGGSLPTTLSLPSFGTWNVNLSGSVWGWGPVGGTFVDCWAEWQGGGGNGFHSRIRVPSNNSGASLAFANSKQFTGVTSVGWQVTVSVKGGTTVSFSVMTCNIMVVAVRQA